MVGLYYQMGGAVTQKCIFFDEFTINLAENAQNSPAFW
jgi:hypothetical protein